ESLAAVPAVCHSLRGHAGACTLAGPAPAGRLFHAGAAPAAAVGCPASAAAPSGTYPEEPAGRGGHPDGHCHAAVAGAGRPVDRAGLPAAGVSRQVPHGALAGEPSSGAPRCELAAYTAWAGAYPRLRPGTGFSSVPAGAVRCAVR